MPVEAIIGAKGTASLDLVITACRDKYGVAKRLAKLDGRRAYATGSSMQHHALARLQAGFHEQVEPCCGKDFRKRGGLLEGERIR